MYNTGNKTLNIASKLSSHCKANNAALITLYVRKLLKPKTLLAQILNCATTKVDTSPILGFLALTSLLTYPAQNAKGRSTPLILKIDSGTALATLIPNKKTNKLWNVAKLDANILLLGHGNVDMIWCGSFAIMQKNIGSGKAFKNAFRFRVLPEFN